jgi:hypothetical protein
VTQKQQTENHGELSEKRIVVLGGSSGIGLAVAQQVVARGARAIIASSNADRVKQAVATLDGKAEGHTLDLSNERDIQNFFQRINDFDHLVFTAGDTLQLNELVATDLTKARRAFELRYWAALAAVKYASSLIRKDGSIVLTTGVAGRRPHKGMDSGRKRLRNYRSPDACLGGRVGADSCQRGKSWRRSNEPLAKHECRCKGAPVRKRWEESARGPRRRGMRDRARLSFPHAGGIQHGTDRGVRWRSGTRLGALPVMNNFQVRVGRTADAPRV